MAISRGLPAVQPQRHRLVVVNSTLHIGGAEQVSACLARSVDRKHFDVSACYLKEPGVIADQMWRDGVNLVPVPGLVAGRKDYLSPIRLRRFIGSGRGTIIHTHDVHGLIAGSFCRLTMPSLKHIHTFHFGNYADVDPYRRSIERVFWRVPDALVAVGFSQRQSIQRIYRIRENRIRVIWNGVEPPQPQAEEPLLTILRSRSEPVIASISTLIPQKGLAYLLDAAALLRESGERFQLLIAGDGHLRDSLSEYAHRKGLSECVHFLGWVPQASDRLLPHCDIFVQSSLWEAMSVVVLEAMAAGKPMVVTRVGENGSVVVNGETGILVQPGDSAALAGGLRTLLHNSDLRKQFGSRARATHEEFFSVRHMVRAYENLYCEIQAN